MVESISFVSFPEALQKLQACNLIKKGTLAQLFSCKLCEIFKNNFFSEHLWTTSSGVIQNTTNI